MGEADWLEASPLSMSVGARMSGVELLGPNMDCQVCCSYFIITYIEEKKIKHVESNPWKFIACHGKDWYVGETQAML